MERWELAVRYCLSWVLASAWSDFVVWGVMSALGY